MSRPCCTPSLLLGQDLRPTRCGSQLPEFKQRHWRLRSASDAHVAQEDASQERRPRTPALQEQPSPSRLRARLGQLAREAPDASQEQLQHRSGDAAGSAQKRAAQVASRRRVAADWVEELTGVALPTASDHAFRAALRDGVLLCRLLNTLRPGYISRVRWRRRAAVPGLLPSCSI